MRKELFRFYLGLRLLRGGTGLWITLFLLCLPFWLIYIVFKYLYLGLHSLPKLYQSLCAHSAQVSVPPVTSATLWIVFSTLLFFPSGIVFYICYRNRLPERRRVALLIFLVLFSIIALFTYYGIGRIALSAYDEGILN